MSEAFDAIVIGAGANGLTAAAALGKAGQRVLLLEAQDVVGGQARLIEFARGFHAPALAGEAAWIPPALARGLGVQLERTDAETSFSVPIDEREFLCFSGNLASAAHTLHRYSARDAVQLHAFVEQLHRFASFLRALYQHEAPDIDMQTRSERRLALNHALKLRRMGRKTMIAFLRQMPMPIEELADDWFETPALKAAIVTGGVRNLQQGPRSGGTTFTLLHHLIGAAPGTLRNSGWWQAGPNALVHALEQAAKAQNVTLRTGAKVARIEVRDDAVTGVVLDGGEEITAPIVLSTTDPARTLLGLIDPVWLDPEFLHAVRNIKLRGCTAMVLYALDALPEFTGLTPESLTGIVLLSKSISTIERAADAAKYGELSEEPHIELTMPTLRWPETRLAPAGKHVMVATVQYAPYRLRDGAPWDTRLREVLADRVTSAIEAVAPCFSSHVLHRTALTPRDIEKRFGLTEGAVTHGELMLDQILFMRPIAGWSRYAMPIRGLYLGGAGTHPGPGIPGGAGWLAAARVLRDRPD